MACAREEAVIAKILSQGCERKGDLDTSVALYFCKRIEKDGEQVFTIPKALEEDGYTEGQLEAIENLLQCYEIDLLPLDQLLIH